MKKILLGIMIFLPVFCFAQQIKIEGSVPRFESAKHYRIQIGSYREAANAERVFNTLKNAGLNPAYENYNDYRRVVLADANTRDFPLLFNTIYAAGFKTVWITEEKTSVVSVVVKGGGAVTAINNATQGPLSIVQTIPSFSANSANTYQANAPIVFFFNNKLYLDSIDGNIDIAVDGRPVNGTATINEGANGFAVLTFTPYESFPVGKEISITMKKELQNDGGNQMQYDVNLSYIAEHGSETNFTINNWGFESGSDGVVFTGDGAIGTAKGSLAPYEGNHYAAISTGSRIVSETGAAIGLTTSQIELGPVPESFSSLDFYCLRGV